MAPPSVMAATRRADLKRLEAIFSLMGKHQIAQYDEGDIHITRAFSSDAPDEEGLFAFEKRPTGRAPTEAERRARSRGV